MSYYMYLFHHIVAMYAADMCADKLSCQCQKGPEPFAELELLIGIREPSENYFFMSKWGAGNSEFGYTCSVE